MNIFKKTQNKTTGILTNNIIDNLKPLRHGKCDFVFKNETLPWYYVEYNSKYFYDYVYNEKLSIWLCSFLEAVDNGNYSDVATSVRKYDKERRKLILENIKQGYEINIFDSKNAEVMMTYFKEMDKRFKRLIKDQTGNEYEYYLMPNFRDLF